MSGLARATAVMSLGTVLSRATGVARLAAVVAALGVAETRLADAYNLANTAPNIIYELVLGGILTSIFVPVFVELLEKEGRDEAWRVASAIINLSLVVLMAVVAIGMLAAPLIARFYTLTLEGSEADAQRAVLTFLLRVFLPQIIFYALAAITAGLLNAHKRFGPPMYTPVLNNLAVIAVFVAFHAAYPSVALDTVQDHHLWIIGVGTTAGVALMAFAQLPFLRGLGRYQLSFNFRHPSVKKLARLSVFVIGYVIANQVGYLIVQVLANGQQGGYSAYVSAFTFFMLPHGLFAVSVITALLPGMSERAVHGHWDDFKQQLSVGIRATVLLVLPAAIGYFVLAEPVVKLLLERGQFSAVSTELVAGVLRFFVLGLVSFSLFQLMLRAFYAMQDSKTPFLINCAAVGLNTAINIPLFALIGVKGLAAGHATAYVFGLALQLWALRKRIGPLGGRKIIESAARIAVAGAVMGAVVWGFGRAMAGFVPEPNTTMQIVTLSAAVVLGIAAFLGFARVLGVEELKLARGIIRRRVEGGRLPQNEQDIDR